MLSMVSRKCGSKAFLKEAGEATRGDMQRKRNTERHRELAVGRSKGKAPPHQEAGVPL